MKIEAHARLLASRHRTLASQIQYAHWTALLDNINEPNKVHALDIWKSIKTGVDQINDFFQHIKSMVSEVAKETGLEISAIVEAFKTRPMFALLKAIKFTVASLVKPIKAFATLYKEGILTLFSKLHETRAFQKLHSGALKLDEFLEEYPILRRLAGPAVAGLLIWAFLAGNFTAHPDLDMDFAALIKAALHGHWSAAELFTSPQGLLAISLVVAGLATPWPSPSWLAVSIPYNLMIAVCYTAFKHAPSNPTVKQGLSHLKTKMKFSTA